MCATGESVSLNVLCDGIADCSNGNDETSPICESKLLYILSNQQIIPYFMGNCPTSLNVGRVCAIFPGVRMVISLCYCTANHPA